MSMSSIKCESCDKASPVGEGLGVPLVRCKIDGEIHPAGSACNITSCLGRK
jgi:hypothetical protein